MTHQELIAAAREEVKDFRDPNGRCPSIEELPKARVVEAAVVYFESDEHDGSIEVYLERDSGKFISATMTPRRREAGE